MAYLTVTTQADVVDPGDGQLSLREAVAQANATTGADYIKFVVTLEGQTLVLTGGELAVTQDLTIDGDRNHDGILATIDGNANGRLLNITGSGTDVILVNIVLRNGESVTDANGAIGNGGAILSMGASLLISGSAIDSSKGGIGGAIFAGSGNKVVVTGSSIDNNYAGGRYGGAIGTGENVDIRIESSKFRNNQALDYGKGGAIFLDINSLISVKDSDFSDNDTGLFGDGGAISINGSVATISRSTASKNRAFIGGAFYSSDSVTNIDECTIENNVGTEGTEYGGYGGGIAASGNKPIVIQNSTITGNIAGGSGGDGFGGAIAVTNGTKLMISNSLVIGNRADTGPDIFGVIILSNGHNIFGSNVSGNVAGDRESVSAGAVFGTIDPATGGGKLSLTGIVPLKNALTNPALSAADPITASSFGQLGTSKRPLPAGSLPDFGSIEIAQKLSTSPTVNNDVLTGSNAANNLSGLAGNDLIHGLAGADTLNGNEGSDVLDGGPGNDKLNGGTGMDIATFAGSTSVVVDLAATPATAKRGGETDTLTSIEGVIGSSKADTFNGDAQNNEFQGGLGKDTATGGGGHDLFAFRAVQDSPPGSGRDVIKDFAPGQDVIDVGNIDADEIIPGQQSFRWVGKATLTGAAQLGYYVSGGNTIVRASTDADAAAELEIQLAGQKALTAADFRP